MLTRTLHRFATSLFPVALLATATTFAANKDHHVVMINLDGFPAYLWRDTTIPLPHLRRLAAEGAAANAMTVSNPSITWPNHTTLVTGVTPRRHGVLYNGLVTRQGPGKPTKREPWVDKTILVRVPTVYDAAHDAGLTTAEVDWVAIKGAKTIDWSFGELPDPSSPLCREMVAAGVATAEEIRAAANEKDLMNIVWRDEMWLRAARFIFEHHHPNLLLFHLLNTDSTHHRYGPGSLASTSALTLADRLVGELLRSIDASGRRAQTTVIVTTDHGFKKVGTHVYANVILKKAGLLRAAGASITHCDAYVGSQGGIAFVYVTDPARRAELVPKLKELFAGAEGVDRVLDGSEAPSLGMPTPEENQAMGELILYPKAGHTISASAAGDAVIGPTIDYGGSHGFPSSDPELDGIFLASGARILKGVRLERVSNLDIAPTIARLLDIPLPNVDGKVIESILEK